MSEELDFLWDYNLNYKNPEFDWYKFTDREQKIIAILCAVRADCEEWD